MSELETIQWGVALVQGNKKDVDIFSDNIKQLKAENEKLRDCLNKIHNASKNNAVTRFAVEEYLKGIDKYKDEG